MKLKIKVSDVCLWMHDSSACVEVLAYLIESVLELGNDIVKMVLKPSWSFLMMIIGDLFH